jgi:hypothetical protein
MSVAVALASRPSQARAAAKQICVCFAPNEKSFVQLRIKRGFWQLHEKMSPGPDLQK